MTELAARTMALRLSLPFARGGATMRLSLTGASATAATVAPYDFRDHVALFDRPPEPRYVLLARSDVALPTTLSIDYDVPGPGGGTQRTASLRVPAGTPAGSSFFLDLGADEGPAATLTRIRVAPAVAFGTVDDAWSITALLGNLAKLLWVTGAERDLIRAQLKRVVRQRHLADALGSSLDFIGSDLRVPRFPPLAYSLDEPTIKFTEALYHLDELPGQGETEVAQVLNVMRLYAGKSTLTGNNAGLNARSGTPGRFGTAFAFRTPAAQVEVADDARLNMATADSFTWECFVKPDSGGAGAPSDAWHLLRKHPDPAGAARPGWALSLGEFGRGPPMNVRFMLDDGTAANRISIFADVSLSSSRFQHLAAVLDRTAGEARLHVDGALIGVAKLGSLGALTNTEKFLIGSGSTAAFRGAIDEVRLSRTAFTSFFPVLGESDDSYRRRLKLFRRWTLPTRANLESLLNEAAGPIGNDNAALVVNDASATVTTGSMDYAVLPVAIGAGRTIDSMGNRHTRESEAAGSPSEDSTFDPAFLVTHDDPARVTYAAAAPRTLAPGELPPDTHKMQYVLTGPLNRLLDLIGAPGSDRLLLQGAFDPRAPDLRSVGRGLLIAHTSMALDQLAALAYRAGFAFISRRVDQQAVYASVAEGDPIGIAVVAGGTAVTSDGFDLRVGETLNLQTVPPLPADFAFRWLTVPAGAGRAVLNPRTDRNAVTLQATAPGVIHVRVEATRREKTVAGTRQFGAGLVDLADGQSIGPDGSLNIDPSVADGAGAFFHPAYLFTLDDSRVDFGTDVNNRRMQAAVARRFTRLVTLIAATGAPGKLTVVQAYAPNATGLAGQGAALAAEGRLLVLSHASAQARLGALAHAAGFTYVNRTGTTIEVRQAEDELIAVQGAGVVSEGTQDTLTLAPRAGPSAVAVHNGTVYVANRGTDTVSEIDSGTGAVRRAFKVGWQPVAIAISADGRSVFTADAAGGTVTRVTTFGPTPASTSLQVGAGPVALAVHPTNPQLFVACQQDNSLVTIDINAMTVQARGSLGHRPTSLAVSPDGRELWATVGQDRTVAIFSLAAATPSQAASISLPQEPAGIVFAPDGKRAYVTMPALGQVVVLDVAGRSILGSVAAGVSPMALSMSADLPVLAVVDSGNPPSNPEQLLTFAPQAQAPFLTKTATVAVRRQPAGVATFAAFAFVANGGSDDISVIDIKPNEAGSFATWRLGSGLGERLSWVIRAADKGSAALSSTTGTTVFLKGLAAAPIQVRALYLLSDAPDPYSFEVRLKPALEQNPDVLIRKDQYDVIMNVLNAFHPAGIEVTTRSIRARVIELREGLLDVFPDYTYPNFRDRGPAARRPSPASSTPK